MRWIKKKNPPNSLQNYLKKDGAIYSDMDVAVMEDLKNSLLNEQENLCAYCQQRIKFKNMTVEHHCEYSICNGKKWKF